MTDPAGAGPDSAGAGFSPAGGGADPAVSGSSDGGIAQTGTHQREATAVIAAALADMDVPVTHDDDDAFLVTLPGERRHRTLVWLLVGAHELLVESFVCRGPDENLEGVYRFLLQRNAGLRTVAYALDAFGDIHLVGRLPLESVTAAEIDTLLGVVLATSDADFNAILERGFADAIRREWAWRTSRGESVKNLQAFRHLIEG